ncbi:hypothetical protein [Klebsiella aerogenes]|uniref:hypothetical protein n=1 Tax=Klebsiella aerogenes TaxID=548 RepID=UPI001D181791|nr:hypothetical protein [Klebsiella aerogenes]
MSAGYPRLLWLWGGLLAVLMILLFLPLSTGGRVLAVGLTAAGVAAGLVYVGRQQRERPVDADWLIELPSAPYRLPIVLVCGDTADWPGEGAVYRTAPAAESCRKNRTENCPSRQHVAIRHRQVDA